jgi:hypothetical protein
MRFRVPPFALAALLCLATSAQAQPTYKLDVKPELKPVAAVRLDGNQIARSAVLDDPGFRLQFHVRRDGKTVATIEARSQEKVDVPQAEPGVYTVTLELFYPAYKGGAAQKGEFKAISNVLTYRVESAEKVAVVNPPPPDAVRAAVGMGPLARK